MKIISPLAVYLYSCKTNKYKKMVLNFNIVNGLHFILYNNMKIEYTKHMRQQLSGLKFSKIFLTFKYFKGSKRKCDRANVYSIHEKFFCDACVKHGVIEDDNDEIIKQSIYLPVEYDKENPRVEISVEGTENMSLKKILFLMAEN